MSEVLIYVVAINSDPDYLYPAVPWPISPGLFFFGPCKRRIREMMRKRYLNADCGYRKTRDDVFIVGVNASSSQSPRKVIWAGKLSMVMTFAEAYKRFSRSPSFRNLLDAEYSPLHLRPILDNDGELIGYVHVGGEHREHKEWVSDLISPSNRDFVQVRGRRLIVKNARPGEVLERDCCMLLESLFCASGEGISFDRQSLNILRKAQARRRGVNANAIFGRTTNGQADGRRGGFLVIRDELGKQFVRWLKNGSRKIAKKSDGNEFVMGKSFCPSPSSRQRQPLFCKT